MTEILHNDGLDDLAWTRRGGKIDRLIDVVVFSGLSVALVHPTFASLYGADGSRAAGLVSLALVLPSFRRFDLGIMAAALLAAVVLVVFSRDVTPFTAVLAGYALFDLLNREPGIVVRWATTVLGLATAVALLQTWMPPDSWINFHATAESVGGFMHQYRPTSIFPSQIYFSHLHLFMIAFIVIAPAGGWWVMSLLGASCAIAGSTAGLFTAMLCVALIGWRKGEFAVVAYLVTVGATYFLAPARFHYNFSLVDLITSIFTGRIAIEFVADEPSGGMPALSLNALPETPALSLNALPEMPALSLIALPGMPALSLIALKLVAIFGMVVVGYLIWLSRSRRNHLGLFALVIAPVGISQAVFPTLESYFFCISWGLLMWAAKYLLEVAGSGVYRPIR